jgi:hypothetical protein
MRVLSFPYLKNRFLLVSLVTTFKVYSSWLSIFCSGVIKHFSMIEKYHR